MRIFITPLDFTPTTFLNLQGPNPTPKITQQEERYFRFPWGEKYAFGRFFSEPT